MGSVLQTEFPVDIYPAVQFFERNQFLVDTRGVGIPVGSQYYCSVLCPLCKYEYVVLGSDITN